MLDGIGDGQLGARLAESRAVLRRAVDWDVENVGGSDELLGGGYAGRRGERSSSVM